MKTLSLALLGAILLPACANISGNSALIYHGQTRCIEQTLPENVPSHTVRWCSSRLLFQPNRHVVTVDQQVLFSDTDYADIKFEKQLGSEKFVGSCIPEIDITDMKSSRPIQVSELPPTLVSACKIQANNHGEMIPFARTAECSAVYAKELSPLVGKAFPFKRHQRCSISANGKLQFSGSFRYE